MREYLECADTCRLGRVPSLSKHFSKKRRTGHLLARTLWALWRFDAFPETPSSRNLSSTADRQIVQGDGAEAARQSVWIGRSPISIKLRLFCLPYAGGVSENVFGRYILSECSILSLCEGAK